jgi:predicted small secreted protein
MKKKTLFLPALLVVVLALEGCATIRGIGEDIQSLGRALKRAVSGYGETLSPVAGLLRF